MRSLTIIAPVFEEADCIRLFYDRLRIELHALKERYSSTILFVCDPSSDGTEDILRQLAAADPTAQVICFSRRFGHQAALLAGMDYASADAVIMMDSDLQHPPAVIPRLLEKFEAGCEIVLTQRRYDSSTGLLKRWLSGLFYRLLQKLSDSPILENSADFRLISGRVCRLFKNQIRERNQFLRGLFSWVGFKQGIVQFDAPPRAGGQTKYNFLRMARFAVAGVASFSKKPLFLSILLGLAFAFFGLALLVLTVVKYLAGSAMPAGFATLLAMISILSGAQLVFIGVIGEYIASIFDETKGRPHYIVDYACNVGALNPAEAERLRT
jgi:glycosyltransferase involved in cell wall biosynthesis